MDNAAATLPGQSVSFPPFAGFTGRGVRIAVIDSGAHPGHPHIAADRLEPGIAVEADGTINTAPDAWLDQVGHGTAVTAAIQEMAPDAHCIPIRVFRQSLRTTSVALLAAIRWATTQRIDVVNLSLGSHNKAHREAFAEAVAATTAAGIVIVAARSADDMPCYPGALPHVIGAELDWDCPRAECWIDRTLDPPVLHAAGYPRPIAGVPQRRNLHGISFAVAQISGFAARGCEALGPRSGVKPILQAFLQQADGQRH